MSDATNALNRRVVRAALDGPFPLELGGELPDVTIAIETYGTLDADGSNALLVCHALTGSAHAAGASEDGRAGWWDRMIGPGQTIDTDRWFVICSNVLGGCYGSTGPTSIDPHSGSPYGATFPAITIRDIVRAQRLALARIGIDRLAAVIGGSMGGMQVLEWGVCFPELVDAVIPIAVGAAHSPWAIAFNAVARGAIALGRAAGDTEAGLRLAREAAMISYRSRDEWSARFGRQFGNDDGFAVEQYLRYHGRLLAARFDATTYDVLLGAMDRHDVTRGTGALRTALAAACRRALVVGISSDVLYPGIEQRTLAAALPNAEYREIDSPCGHDAFLIEFEQLDAIIRPWLERHAAERTAPCAAGRHPHHSTDNYEEAA